MTARLAAASCTTWAPSAGSFSAGYAINNAGQVVGDSSTTGNTANHAFRYTGTPGAGGVMVDLGTLGGALQLCLRHQRRRLRRRIGRPRGRRRGRILGHALAERRRQHSR